MSVDVERKRLLGCAGGGLIYQIPSLLFLTSPHLTQSRLCRNLLFNSVTSLHHKVKLPHMNSVLHQITINPIPRLASLIIIIITKVHIHKDKEGNLFHERSLPFRHNPITYLAPHVPTPQIPCRCVSLLCPNSFSPVITCPVLVRQPSLANLLHTT